MGIEIQSPRQPCTFVMVTKYNMYYIVSVRYIYGQCTLCACRAITHVAGCLLDIAFVVDCSDDMRNSSSPGVDNWQYVVEFMVNIVSSLHIARRATHVGAVTFGTQLKR